MDKSMDRRSFLQTAAVGAVALAGTGALAGCASASQDAAPEASGPKTNRVCELLGIEKPVISAQMASLTDAKFVAAVSEAGGFGMLQAATLSTAAIYDTPEEILRIATESIHEIRELTDKPFGVNMPYQQVPGFLEMLLEEKPAAVNPYGLTTAEIYDLRDAGIKIFGYVQDADVETAKQAAQECDLMFVKCYGCGGHVPRRRANALSLMELYANQGIEVPMIPGGGITNAAGAAAMARAGAEGVWVGTRFIVTEENPAHPDTKQAIIDLTTADMIEFGASTGGWLHTSNTPKAQELLALYLSGASTDELAEAYGGMYLYGMRLGQLDDWMINVSDSVDSITEMKTVKEVVDELGDAFLAAQA